MKENSLEIPAVSVERFATAYRAFVAAVRQAIEDGQHQIAAMAPSAPAAADLSEWQTRVLPLLENRYAEIEHAVAQFQEGNGSQVAQCALDASGLAKNLDNFSLDFSGQEHQEELKALLSRVVLAAYPIYSAAGLT